VNAKLARRVSPDRLLRLQLVLAIIAWWLLYRINGPFWDRVVYGLLGLERGSRLAESVRFFVYDTTKILLLLSGVIFAVTILRSFMTLERTRALLGGRREGIANVAAAGLGVITPFCSCSAVPVFIGFVAAGVPIGVTLSFLIASPLVNEVAVGLLFSLFGWQIALLYVAAGLTLATVAGAILGRMHTERWVEPFVFETPAVISTVPGATITWRERVDLGRREVVSIVRRILPYLLVGIGIGAIIHGWVPTDFFVRWAGPGHPLGVPVAVLLGVPLYSNAAGVMPLVEVLHGKGVPMGTLLAFMMSVVALSLPELVLLRRVLRPPLIAAFVGVVATGIGYLFNLVL
jgi:uncharacterized membrane protein YraQ (UPF0718 family)